MSNIIIVIPTYWTWPSGQAHGPVETFFDHPTPVDGTSTLPRLLESLTALKAAPGRLVSTPVAFGGNMVFHRDLFTQIGFDPGITRGEDIDYLINARMADFNFWLDKKLVITHLPPHHYNLPPYVRMSEDVRRFLYEQKKLRLAVEQGIHTPTLAELSPYPGYFLTDDVADQAQSALEAIVTPELAQTYGAPADIVTLAQKRARQLAPGYFEFAQTWPRLMEAVTEDSALSERFAVRIYAKLYQNQKKLNHTLNQENHFHETKTSCRQPSTASQSCI